MSKMGFVLGTLESEYCLEVFGGKKFGLPGQTSMVFFFTWKTKSLFLCQMKWENFFCAWWVQWELLVPSLLNCTVVLCITGGITFPATCLLTIWGFTCWEFSFPFVRQVVSYTDTELTDFSSFSFFQSRSWSWGYRKCKVKKYLS